MRDLRFLGFGALIAVAATACADESVGGATATSSNSTTTTTTTTGGDGGGGTSTSSAGGSGGDGGQGGEANASPAAPTMFAAASSAQPLGVALTWTAPPDGDLAGYLVTRSLTPPAAFGPADGATYAPGEVIAGAGEVIYAGAAASADDLAPAVPAGVKSHYQLWARDAGGLYSSPAAATSIDFAVPAKQPATLSVSDLLGSPTVSVTQQPIYGKLTATAVVDLPGNTMTVTLSVENDASRPLYNTKAVVDATNLPAGVTIADGTTFEGQPCAYYGPAALAVGGEKTRTFTIKGVDGTVDPVTIDLHLENHPMLLVGDGNRTPGFNAYDTSGARDGVAGYAFGGNVQAGPMLGYKVGIGHFAPGAFSPDGAMLYAGFKNMPYVATIDMTTLAASAGADLAGGSTGHTSAVRSSPDGQFLYIAVTIGAHHRTPSSPAYAGTSDVDLVKLDRVTMEELGRVHLVTGAPAMNGEVVRAGDLAISPDGTRAVVPIMQAASVWIVDLTTLAIVDVDAATAGDQGVDVSAAGVRPRVAAIDPASASAYIGEVDGDAITVIDLSTFTAKIIGSASVPLVSSEFHWSSLSFGPNGKLYIARKYLDSLNPMLSVYDPSTSSYTDIMAVKSPYGVAFDPGGLRFYAPDAFDVRVYSTVTSAELDTDSNVGNGLTPLPMTTISDGHIVTVTPF